MKKLFMLAFLSSFILVQSQPINTEKLNAFLKVLEVSNSPGYAVGIIKDNKLVYEKTFGLSSIEANAAITNKTQFIIGSLTKQFIGYGIAILINQHKLNLTDDIRLYLPEYHNKTDTIRIKHLLYHTSGLYDYNEIMSVCGNSYTDFNKEQLIQKMAYAYDTLLFKPGSKFAYNNTGYYLLSKIIEKVSGLSINDFAQQYIFGPASMKNTYFYVDSYKQQAGLAFSYTQDIKGVYKKIVSVTPPYGAGNVSSTLDDLIKWEHFFYNSTTLANAINNIILTKGTLNNGDTLKYSFGLKTGVYKNKKVIYHSGDYNSFESVIVRVPEYGISVIVLSNDKKAKTIIDNYSIANRLIDIVTDSTAKPKLPDFKLAPIKEDKKINEFTGVYSYDKGKAFINYDDGQLKISYSYGDWYYSIFPISDSIFNDEYDYSFLYKFKIVDNNVTGLWTKYTGFMKKLKPDSIPKPSTDCIGTYFSKELNTSYKLYIEKDKLYCKINSKPPKDIIVLENDKFRSGKNTIKLIRNNLKENEYLLVNEKFRLMKIE